MKKITICLILLLLVTRSFGQANTCATANNAGTVSGTSCATAGFNQSIDNNGNLSGAQRTSELQGATGCGVSAQDVHWEMFTASSTFTVIEWNGISEDGKMTVFSGSCGSLTELGCDDGNSGSNLSVSITTTPSNTYYVRVQRDNNGRINGNMCIYSTQAPSSPGGAGTINLSAWFKADALTLGNVTSWTTTYPTGSNAITVEDASSPYSQATNTPAASIFNYNSVVDFNGNDDANQMQLSNTSGLDLLTNQNSGSNGSFFVVYAVPTAGDNDGVVTYKNGQHGIQMRSWGRLAIGDGNSANGTREFTPKPATQPLIVSYKGNKSSGTSMTAFRDDLIFTTTFASSAAMSAGLTFGAKRNTSTSYNEYFSGYLSEVIFFNSTLSNAEANRIHSYLGIKYGVTLDNSGGGAQGDYLSTDGATIWDASLNVNYHNDVIGIGRDDIQGLLQKQSHSFDDTTRIYLNTLASTNAANGGSFSNDISYVTLGHNQGRLCSNPTINSEIPGTCGLNARLEREWKITKTNLSDNFNLDVKLNACANQTSVNVAHLRLLVDDDGDFSNGGTTCYFNGDGTGISFSYTNPIITITGISATHIADNSTRYITIASSDPVTALPVDLLTFKASCNNNFPILEWTTASETNNDYFTIHRSNDAVNFKTVGTTTAQGNSSNTTHYSWRDDNPLEETAYYSLSQTDFNGNHKYLKTTSSNCTKAGNVLVYPNPFKDGFMIELPENITYPINLEITDFLGRTVYHQLVRSKKIAIDAQKRFRKGTYNLRIYNAYNFINKRLIKASE